jgi:hypothetical protein
MTQVLWTQKQDTGPSPRRDHKMSYDLARGRVFLFGGISGDVGPVFNDSWEWDGECWTQVADVGPTSRFGHATAGNSRQRKVVLFGGFALGGSASDTWEWDGSDWTQVADTGPSPRHNHAMAYDSKRDRIILFSGRVGVKRGEISFPSDTWAWDGNDWTQIEDTGPAGRSGHAMAYDTARDRVVLFGGDSTTDTWEFDGTTWSKATTMGPEACINCAMVYDEHQILLFGGERAGSPTVHFNSTWTRTGKHWTQRQDIGPSPRSLHSMAYDSKRSRVVLFGGANPQSGQDQLGDTWEQFERPILRSNGG